jgi:hypothetical protein
MSRAPVVSRATHRGHRPAPVPERRAELGGQAGARRAQDRVEADVEPLARLFRRQEIREVTLWRGDRAQHREDRAVPPVGCPRARGGAPAAERERAVPSV